MEQEFDCRLLEALLRAAGDPDWRYMDKLARGVHVGVEVKMPSTPSVYVRKRKWAIKSQELGDEIPGGPKVAKNFKSAQVHRGWLRNHIDGEVQAKRMVRVRMSIAKARYCRKLRIAALGCIEKGGRRGGRVGLPPQSRWNS